MNPFEMVLGIVFFACATKVIMSVVSAFGRRKETQEDRELDMRLRRVEALEERVRVLEKIVTDRRYDLKRELDELERTP
jgi:membrane protein implicated in regulation of membrane protease activity